MAAQQHIVASRRECAEGRLERHGFKVYLQNDEDGIIAEIFRRVRAMNRRFLELGSGDGRENNTAFLLLQGWTGHWFDGSLRGGRTINRLFHDEIVDGRLAFTRAFITASNINDLLRNAGCVGEIDLLSIDLDGNDYHIPEAIEIVRPRVICAEYNAKFPPPIEWIMPRDDYRVWDGSDWFGASLASFQKLADDKGYALVGCNITGINAFFVRRSLISEFAAPFTAEHLYQPPRYHLRLGFCAGQPPRLQ